MVSNRGLPTQENPVSRCGLNLSRILHSNCLEIDAEGNNLPNAKLRQNV